MDSNRFLEKLNKDPIKKNLRDELAKGQHPSTLVICCSDSRVAPEIIFDTFLGEIFVIRTAGNVVNEGELATIEYAIDHLHIKHIIVLGHTHCGAIHSSYKKDNGKYMSPILNRIRSNIIGIDDEKEASRINALKETEYIKNKFPDYDGIIEAKVYDIETSKIN